MRTAGRRGPPPLAIGLLAVALVGAGVTVWLLVVGVSAGRDRLLTAPVASRAPRERTAEGAAGAYRLAWSLELGLGDARALASVDDGVWAVAGDRVLTLVSRGGVGLSVPLEGEPTCLAVRGSERRRFYACVGDHVDLLEQSGSGLVGVGESQSMGSDAYLVSIALLPEGYCVSDVTSAVVFVLLENGRIVGAFGKGTFLLPSPSLDLAPAGAGRVWVAYAGRHRVERWNVRGELEFDWGTYSSSGDGFAGCCNPVHIAVLPDGRLVAAEKGVLRVRVFSEDGRPEATVTVREPGGALAPASRIADLAVDRAGRVAILDATGPTLLVFEPDGAP